jgi:hypothetical protein
VIRSAPNFPSYFEPGAEKNFHNAGYDAFCTGAVFARQISTIDRQNSLILNESSDPSTWMVHSNMLFMMRSLYHMDLGLERPNGIIKFSGVILRSNFFNISVSVYFIIIVAE